MSIIKNFKFHGSHEENFIEYITNKLLTDPTTLFLINNLEIQRFLKSLPLITFIPTLIKSLKSQTPITKDIGMIIEFFEKYNYVHEFPIIFPKGFKIDNKDHLDWIYNAISFHIKEEFRGLIHLFASTLPLEEIAQKGLTTYKNEIYQKLKEYITTNIVKNSSNELSRELVDSFARLATSDIAFDMIKDIITSLIGISGISTVVNAYSQSFDLVISFFVRPVNSTDNSNKQKRTTRQILIEAKKRFPELLNLLNSLDPDLRNAFSHRNYFYNEITKELTYYKFYPSIQKDKNAPTFFKVSYNDLIQRTFRIKYFSLILFGGMLLYKWFNWFKEKLSPALGTFLIFYPEIPVGMFEIINEFFLTNIIFHDSKNPNSIVDSALNEFKILFLTDNVEKYLDTKQKMTELELFNKYWNGYLERQKNTLFGPIVYGYFLFILHLRPDIARIVYVTKTYIEGFMHLSIDSPEAESIILETIQSISFIRPDQIEYFLTLLNTRVATFFHLLKLI